MRVYLSLGSNINREHNITACLSLLAHACDVVKRSAIFESTPGFGRLEQDNYFNMAVLIDTKLTPQDLKSQVLKPIEQKLKRQRSADKNQSRTIDVDISLWGNLIINEPNLTIPDPDIATCPHVAVPLADLDGDFIHPLLKQSLNDIAAKIFNGQVIWRAG